MIYEYVFQSTSQDSASLIQNTPGYYAGSEPIKFWWKHPKIKENWKTVSAALVLVLLGLGEHISLTVLYFITVDLLQDSY